jgi:hypothetical protein
VSREVKRVPLDFEWPLDKTWSGYIWPDKFHENQCPDCESGRSPRGQYLHDMWYGNVPFHPSDTGSTVLTPETPAVRAFAERNVASAPDFYGSGAYAVYMEGRRLANLWNGMWSHHLTQEDVDALIAEGRLMDFTHTCDRKNGWQPIVPAPVVTAAEVNEWSLRGMGHDSLNAHYVVDARCEREGVPLRCATCNGNGSLEAYPGQRAEAEAWERTDPPAGDGWQLWETVSDGSPITPVFAAPEELARYMTRSPRDVAAPPMASTFEVAMRFIDAGWCPSGGSIGDEVVTGVELVGREPVQG